MKKADINSFAPEIWVAEKMLPILVCANRATCKKGDAISGALVVSHTVAIELRQNGGFAVGINLKLTREKTDWTCYHAPETKPGRGLTKAQGAGMIRAGDYEISVKAASAALREAWRMVDSKTNNGIMKRVIKYDLSPLIENSTITRNIMMWLSWTRWDKLGFSQELRAAELREMGFDCTLDALKEEAKKVGI